MALFAACNVEMCDLNCLIRRGDSTTCVVILNWNGSAHTLRCINHVLAQTVPAAIVVIDNGSAKEDVEALRAKVPAGCGLVELRENRGFAGGMNVGINAALRYGYEYVWVLNNDAFPDPHCLQQLVAALAADPGLGAVTPALYNPDGAEQHAGGRVQWLKGTNDSYPAAQLNRSLQFGEWLTGTALLLRAAAVRSLGGFDERFFAYWEDVDLCVRLHRAGWQMRAVPEAHCVHLMDNTSSGGGEAPFAFHLFTRNAWLLRRKHLPRRSQARAFVGWFVFYLRHAISCHQNEQRQRCLAVLGGLLAVMKGESRRPRRILAPAILRRALTWRWSRVDRFLHWLRPDVCGSGPSRVCARANPC